MHISALSLTSELDVGDCSMSRVGRLTPWNATVQIARRQGGF